MERNDQEVDGLCREVRKTKAEIEFWGLLLLWERKKRRREVGNLRVDILFSLRQ
jgi:predicted nucleotidyltransferase